MPARNASDDGAVVLFLATASQIPTRRTPFPQRSADYPPTHEIQLCRPRAPAPTFSFGLILDRDARVARLQKRWATSPPEWSYKDDDSTTVADDSASEAGKLSALGKVDSLPGKVSVAKGRTILANSSGENPWLPSVP
jgi:hypothetical protein